MASADELAFGVLDGLRMCGCRVPNDVLVTGFDGLPQSAWEGYRLTTLVQPIEQLVKEALVYLTDPVGLPAIVVDGALRIGGTTSKEAPHG
jgi:DNA-binding LacI/PurR family transcriptional regulator